MGVDIERIRPDIEYQEIAARYFSPGERSAIITIDEKYRPELFYKLWTRKEAYMKGRGMGLSIPPDSFDISQVHHGVCYPVEIFDDEPTNTNWCILDLPSTNNFAAALALECRKVVIKTWNWIG